jgi:serine/threonine protein kinase
LPLHHRNTLTPSFINDARYRPRRGLGRGAYGIVVSAYDQDNKNIKVAIKRVLKLFQGELIDAKRIVREIKLLSHFKHENVVSLIDLYPSPGPFKDISIVMDFMDTDLHNIIYSNNVLTDDHLQFFMYQLLRGLKYIHSAGVIHRDLKPSNLLVNGECHLKIADFGLARGYGGQNIQDQYLTEYVVTRWYRAPEIMCSSDAYDFKIDVWAAGCILAEMFLRKPIFPGDDYKKQLNVIFDILGTPSEDDLTCVSNEYALSYIRELEFREKIPFEALFDRQDMNKDALDLLEKLLKFDPAKRLSIDEALAHPWFHPYHSTQSEPTADTKWDASFEDDLQDNDLSVEKLQRYFLEEIYKYRPELREKYDRGSFYGEELYKQ